MGRPRKRRNAKLPPYVYRAKGRYFLRQYLGTRNGKTKWGKEIRLANADAPIAEVWAAYSALSSGHAAGRLGWLVDQYLISPQFKRVSKKTKDLYESYWSTIGDTKTSTGIFADEALDAITPGVIRVYLDRRAEVPHQANKERSFLSVLFAYAVERDWMRSNPASKTKPFPVKPRDRYVDDSEYEIIHKLSLPYVQQCMEIAYLCRARQAEVLALKKSSIKENGLQLVRGKGSKSQIIGWTDRLRAAVEASTQRFPNVQSQWIVHDKRGQKVLQSTLQATWGRKMRKAFKEGLLKERFTFHDLKAKGVSDFEGNKFLASGHKSPNMLAVYDRKLEVVPSTR